MKIAFLNLYSNKIARGAESFAHSLAEELEKKGHKVTFYKGDSALMPTNKFSGAIFHTLLKRLFLDKPGREVLQFSLDTAPKLIKEDFDVVIPMNGFWQLLIVKLIQIFKGYKVIVTGHSGPGWDERWNLYLKPTYFVATTGPTLAWAQKTAPWTQSTLIPYGINPGIFDPGINNPGIMKGVKKPIVLCPSALVPYKRVDLAVKAVAELEKGSLVILGKGPLEKKIKRLGEKLLGDRFLLTAVPYDRVSDYFAAADVITLPSESQENSPMVFLEALASGKPTVATDAPRVQWALEDAGFYVDPTDTKAYANQIKQALKSKTNTSKALKKFFWPSVIKKYEKIFLS